MCYLSANSNYNINNFGKKPKFKKNTVFICKSENNFRQTISHVVNKNYKLCVMLITILSKNKIVENVSAGGGDNNTSSVGLGFVKTCGEFALRSGKKFILKIYEFFTKYNDIMTFSST